jgi:hypothetical protein
VLKVQLMGFYVRFVCLVHNKFWMKRSIDPFMITAVLRWSGTFVSVYNTLSRKMMS